MTIDIVVAAFAVVAAIATARHHHTKKRVPPKSTPSAPPFQFNWSAFDEPTYRRWQKVLDDEQTARAAIKNGRRHPQHRL